MSGNDEPGLEQLLSRLERRLSQRLVQRLAHMNSSLREWRLLSCLATLPGRTMTDVADLTLLPAATTTRLIDDMVSDNLVYRKTDDTDRRRVLIYLSSRGWERYERLRPAAAEEQAALSELYGQQDMRQLIRLLTELIQRVDEPSM